MEPGCFSIFAAWFQSPLGYQYLIALFKGLPHAHTADDYETLLP
jgi:hypothetical protein